MTTLKDYLRDLVVESIAEVRQKNEELDLKELTEHEIEDLVDMKLDTIKYFLIGGES